MGGLCLLAGPGIALGQAQSEPDPLVHPDLESIGEPRPPPPPATAPEVNIEAEPSAWLGVAKWAFGGAALVLAASAVYLGLDTVARYHRLENRCPGRQCGGDPMAIRLKDRVETQRLLTNLVWGSAGIFGAASVTFFVLQW